MYWLIFGILFVIIFMFAFAFARMVKESMKYFWYEYYEDEDELEDSNDLKY